MMKEKINFVQMEQQERVCREKTICVFVLN